MRHAPRFSSPSNTAKTVLVLLELTTRSISRLPPQARRSFYDFSVRNNFPFAADNVEQEASAGIQADKSPFPFIAVSSDFQRLAQRVSTGEPGFAQRRKPLAAP